MDFLLLDGDMAADYNGDMQSVKGLKEILQRAMIRLTVKKGSFAYQSDLGSELYHLDLYRIDDFLLFSYVSEALKEIQEITVMEVEKKIDYEEKVLYLTVYLKVSGEDAILEINRNLWE